MNVEAHSAAPVPTEAMNSQPIRVAPVGGAGAGEMAHADPGAEQADRAGEQHQHLVVGEGVTGDFCGMTRFPLWSREATGREVNAGCRR